MRKRYGYTELLEDLLKLKEAYGERICIKNVGLSVKNRLIPLIESGKAERKKLVVAAIHGREYVSSVFIMKSLKEFLKNSCQAKDTALYILPMLNPDGVEIFWGRDFPVNKHTNFEAALYKNNANNINLNANFPFCFHKVPSVRQGGKTAASEPETKALIRLCEKERFEAAVSLHARGNCIFWRDLGNGAVKGDYELARCLGKTCGFELIPPTRNAEDYSGGFENWFRFKYKKPALCVELVEDEGIGFADMCNNFEEAVIFEKTGSFLKTFADFS